MPHARRSIARQSLAASSAQRILGLRMNIARPDWVLTFARLIVRGALLGMLGAGWASSPAATLPANFPILTASGAAPAVAPLLLAAAAQPRLQPSLPAQKPAAPSNVGLGAAVTPVTNQFELLDGERVVLVGDRFMEQELEWGYLETRLTLQYPDRNVRFRNLGWIRVPGFSDPSTHRNLAGPEWDRLLAQVAAFKPTVAVVAYGTEAADCAPSHLDTFLANYTRLLDALTAAGATNATRWLLLGPARLEQSSAVTNSAPGHSAGIALWNAALQDLASQRQARFVSLSSLLAELPRYGITNRLSDERGDLTRYGFRLLVDLLTTRLGWEANIWRVGITRDGQFRQGGYGITTADLLKTTNRIRFTGRLEQLPSPPVLESNRPLPGLRPPGMVQFVDLSTEPWMLHIDGQRVKGLLGPLWSRGVPIDSGPDSDQAEQLRQTIVQKNRLVRTQLERPGAKQSGGSDERIVSFEKAIARLRVPVTRTYELVPVPAVEVLTNLPPSK